MITRIVKLEFQEDKIQEFLASRHRALSKKNKPISINELQTKVWEYHSDIETHTVETHIYRLRKKILKIFGDDKFIITEKNGYQIK